MARELFLIFAMCFYVYLFLHYIIRALVENDLGYGWTALFALGSYFYFKLLYWLFNFVLISDFWTKGGFAL